MKESAKEKDAYFWGIISALLLLQVHGYEVAAVNVVDSVGGLFDIERVINKRGGEVEVDLLCWLKKQYEN
jgi:hypothetical protein